MHSEERMELVGFVSVVQFWRLQRKIRHFEKQLSVNFESSSVDVSPSAGGRCRAVPAQLSLKESPIPELVGNS